VLSYKEMDRNLLLSKEIARSKKQKKQCRTKISWFPYSSLRAASPGERDYAFSFGLFLEAWTKIVAINPS